MAKQLGIQIKGSIDGYSFYHDSRYGYLVRKTGGLTSKQYHTDNRYAAARDASSEFSNVSRAGKLMRNAFGEFAQQVKDGSMVNRLNKELIALKQLDNLYARGQRKPETMMTDPEANKWLRIFQFNEKVNLNDMLDRRDARHRVHQKGFKVKLKPKTFPQDTTHAGLTLVRTVIDFENNCFQTSSSRMAFVSADNPVETSLTIPACHSGKGIEILCLQVVFFEERNGDFLPLSGKVHGMGILKINTADPVANCSAKKKSVGTGMNSQDSKRARNRCAFRSHKRLLRGDYRLSRRDAFPVNTQLSG